MNALFRTIRTNQALHEIGLTSMVRGRCFFKQSFDLGGKSEGHWRGGFSRHVAYNTLLTIRNQVLASTLSSCMPLRYPIACNQEACLLDLYKYSLTTHKFWH